LLWLILGALYRLAAQKPLSSIRYAEARKAGASCL
jgi:hypothetical protein